MKSLLGFVVLGLLLTGCQHLPEVTSTPTTIPATPSPKVIDLLIPTETICPTPTATLSPTPTLPLVSIITDMVAYKQDRPLDCEARAAVDWAAYFDVSISEYDFQFNLPISDNPDLGFVGTSNSLWGQTPPYAYGVHAGPVADLLKNFGLNAVAVKGMTLEKLKRQISAGHPLIAWVIGNCEGGVPAEYVDSKGNKTVVAAYEHVVIVIGYTADNIRYYNAGKMYEVPDEVFLNSWGVLGNMAVVWGG